MKLEVATALAQKIKASLCPIAQRVEIAGSIRRKRPHVGDIDLVILATDFQREAVIARCSQNWTPRITGPQNCIFARTASNGLQLQLDIFFAKPASYDLLSFTPTNFGSLLLCRTGSKEHNIYLVEHAKTLGLKWKPYQGVFDSAGNLLASESEENIFRTLHLDFIPPEKRERL